jgi:hypothetical protein
VEGNIFAPKIFDVGHEICRTDLLPPFSPQRATKAPDAGNNACHSHGNGNPGKMAGWCPLDSRPRGNDDLDAEILLFSRDLRPRTVFRDRLALDRH